MRARGTSKTTRLRKASCSECGYIIRVSRSCMERGLPSCSCGAGPLSPDDPADMIELGLLSLDDLSRTDRTDVCRRMGWEDEIVRTSPSQMPGARRPIRIRQAQPMPF